MTGTTGYCWHCATPLTAADFSREAVCAHCQRHTHVCRNCRFYKPGAHNQCQEPVADYVADKTRANFCDYFSPDPKASGGDRQTPSAHDLRAAADALFGPGDESP